MVSVGPRYLLLLNFLLLSYFLLELWGIIISSSNIGLKTVILNDYPSVFLLFVSPRGRKLFSCNSNDEEKREQKEQRKEKKSNNLWLQKALASLKGPSFPVCLSGDFLELPISPYYYICCRSDIQSLELLNDIILWQHPPVCLCA